MCNGDAHHASIRHIDRPLYKSFSERAPAYNSATVVVLKRTGDNLSGRGGVFVNKYIDLDVAEATIALSPSGQYVRTYIQ